MPASADLAWGQTYYWVAQDYDGLDWNADPEISYFSTPVPQPLVTSGLSQNTSGPGFDPANGNYTTSATDAKVSTVGPALGITRDYNSDDPRTTGAFGAGWSSILDMKVTPGQADSSGNTATEVVTYPDGNEVGFGLNPTTGAYSPPPGQYAQLRSVSGGFTLTDKNDTVYTFTQSLTGGGYGITKIADALGNTETFTNSSSDEITKITSASKRTLSMTWNSATPAHVASVTTGDVTTGNNSSALTWTYAYSGNELTSVCPPSGSTGTSSTACTVYTYGSGSDYPESALDSGPHSYWRLDESSGTVAASSVLANEGADDASYSSGVSLANAGGGLAGSSAKVPDFNGTSGDVHLPPSLVNQAAYMSVSLWFWTTTDNGVLFSYENDPLSDGTTTADYTPALYIGSDGKLNAQFWNGKVQPITTSASVANGQWHMVTLTASGNTQTLYLDGQRVSSLSGAISVTGQANDYLGAGFVGASWPDESHEGEDGPTAYATYYRGFMSDASIWGRALTPTEVTAMYAAGTGKAALLSNVTRPSGNVYAQVGYGGVDGTTVTGVTDSNGGSWTMHAPTVTGSSQVYVASVLGAQPDDYYRLADTGTTDAVDQVAGGTATYTNVTQGASGPFSDAKADTFTGSDDSYITLPSDDRVTAGPGTVELWFKTTAKSAPLYSTDQYAPSSGEVGAYTPSLYIGSDGNLYGEFWNNDIAETIGTTTPVNDGKWHFVVLSGGTSTQTLYLDGKQVGSASGALSSTGSPGVYLGAGDLGGAWPATGTAQAYFYTGSMAEFAYFPSQLSAAQVADQYAASQESGGLAPVETATVTDPGAHTLTYKYDPDNGNRILSQTDGLGNTTSYGYDVNGFQDSVVDPNGDVTDTGYDVRGNAVSQTTCQDQATQTCSTDYYTYYPNDTNANPAADPRNDMMLTSSDGRSASATDAAYRTTYAYNTTGTLASVTTPPVAGFPNGRPTSYSYTDGSSTAGGYANAVPPPGLPYREVSPGGATTTTLYNATGDVMEVTDPDGQQTQYVYDGLGRVVSQTVTSDTYPDGLTTSYAYNANGQVVTETDPPVTDMVTGATHAAETSTTYDADGNVTAQTVSDQGGGDASRGVTYTYNANDLVQSYTDATGAKTAYTYNAYGDLATETGAAGDVTQYAYDPNGSLLTVTLDNYTGNPSDPQTAAPLVESCRSYDPNGRLASITDAMGDVTSYGYTDNGLLATVTRSAPSSTYTNNSTCPQPTGASYVEESDTYDAAGNLTRQVTDNGGTTTNYAVDAADRVQTQTLDPSGVDRVSSYTYTPDDDVLTKSVSSGTSGPSQVTGYSYDGTGNEASQSVHGDATPGTPAQEPSGWWPLTDGTASSLQYSPTAAADDSGNGHTATTSGGVTWGASSPTLDGSTGYLATSGPVVSTTGSYSVSAWVDLAAAGSGYQTVVGQDGTTNSAFNLQYDPTTGDWNFARNNTDASGPSITRAMASQPAAAGTWTHLVGTYNASTGAMSIYVNGTLSGSATDTTTWASSGPLTIGRGLWGGNPSDHVNGQIANVQAYPYALSGTQVASLYNDGRAGAPIGMSGTTTSWTLDERGLPTSMTDPDGNVTDYTYDAAGRLAQTVAPTVQTTVYNAADDPAVTQTSAHPVTTTGYNTFGDVAETEDPDGNVTTYGYDADSRQTSETMPSYTPPTPTGAAPITDATWVKQYNGLGQVTSSTDPMNYQTGYTYDQLGDLASETAADGGVTNYTYDADGDQLAASGPAGQETTATYDYLGRQLTSTEVENVPSPTSYTTNYAYAASSTDPGGSWMSSSTSPDLSETQYGYDAAGEVTSVTDGAGDTTGYGYDPLGRQTTVTSPDGSQQVTAYDVAGDPLSVRDYCRSTTTSNSGCSGNSGNANLVSTGSPSTATYDGDGDPTSQTDPDGNTTTFSYGPTGLLTQEVQPVTASSSITTSFGYDADGNKTQYTDGDGNTWNYTYNSWGLPESEVEPSTSQYSSAADSTFTDAYNADGQPATEVEPGGVTVTSDYNPATDTEQQTATGASVATPNRTIDYNQAGDLTSATTSNTASSGQPSNATAESFSYDDRGLLVGATGSGGSSSYAYNGDDLPTSVTDAAGTTSYTYDDADRLSTLADPATGTTATYGYNDMSQVQQISYGTGNDTQAFTYNTGNQGGPIGELTGDTLTSGSTTVASIAYGYDADGNTTSIDASGLAGASDNSYTYDDADRLTSWDNGTTTTQYGYDGAGNLTQDGSQTYAYDARDELTSDGTNSYSYTANGTLASETTPAGTVSTAFDGYGDLASSGSQTYTYDALGRVLSDSGNGQDYAFSYAGSSDTLASDGVSTYTWDPSGTALTGIGTVGGTESAGALALTNQHGDVVGDFTAGGTSLTGSQAFDPWGKVTATTGSLSGQLGYQSGWTDPGTGKVSMGSRWYSPSTAGFTSKDTASNSPVPDSAGASPFAYAGDDPLGATDPSGHQLVYDGSYNVCGGSCAAQESHDDQLAAQETQAQAQWSQPAPQVSTCHWYEWCGVVHAYHAVVAKVRSVIHYVSSKATVVGLAAYKAVRRTVVDVSTKVEDEAAQGARSAAAAFDRAASAGARAYHAVTTYASDRVKAVVHVVATAYHRVARAATATAEFVRHHEAAIASFAASTAVFVGCEAVTSGLGSVGCGAIAGAVGSAVSYGITAAQSGHFSWAGLGETVAEGAIEGAAGGELGELVAGLGSGAADAASALADSAGGEAVAGAGDVAGDAAAEAGGDAGGGAGDLPKAADASGAGGDPSEVGGASGDGGAGNASNNDAGNAGNGDDGPTCGGRSFSAGTKAVLASGAAVAISALKVGDKVLATSTKTGKTTPEKVTAVLVHYDTDLYDLTVKTSRGTEVIDTTSGHLFWDPSLDYGWIPAKHLKPGMHLKTPDGQSAVVVGGSVPAVHDGWMWDLTVPGDNDHDFYVTVAETAVLVHNCGPSEASLDNEAEAHIRARHFPGGAEVDSSSGIFNADESIDDLVDLANTQEASPNEYGLYERVVNAGRVIGRTSELQGNLPTTTYRLWQDYYGGIMSMHPIPG